MRISLLLFLFLSLFPLKVYTFEQFGPLLAMRESVTPDFSTERSTKLTQQSNRTPSPERKILSYREQYTKDLIDFKVYSGSFGSKYSEDPSRDEFEVSSASLTSYQLDWLHASEGRFQAISGVHLKKIDMNKDEIFIDYDSDTFIDLRLGTRYYLNSRWGVRSFLYLSQMPFFHFVEGDNSAESFQVEKTVVPKIVIGVDGELVHAQSGRFRLGVNADISYSLSKNAGDFNIDNGFGIDFKTYARYWYSSRLWLQIGLNLSHQSYQTDSQDADFRGKQSFSQSAFVLSLGVPL